jgi:hypothetical protein
MTGPEHYQEAERLLQGFKNHHGAITVEDGTAEVFAAAQVHATLALAAATALNDNDPGLPVADLKEWREAVGTNIEKGTGR